MKLQELTGGIRYLTGAFFMFYLVEGSRETALIELGVSQLVPQILHDIEEGTGGNRPGILVAPHGHFDHAGAASRWRKALPGAQLCGHERTAAILSDTVNIERYTRAMASTSDNPFFKQIYPLAEDEVFMEAVGFDTILAGGDEVDPGGMPLKVFETPGHSECSLSFFHEPSRTLFVSDSCGMPMASGRIWPTAFLDRARYGESLEKLMKLEAEHLCTGHNPPISGGKRIRRFFEKNLEALDNFFAKVENLWTDLGDRDAVLSALKEEYAKDAMPGISWVIKYGNKEMARQVIDGVPGRG